MTDQTAQAKIAYDYWLPKVPSADHAFAILGNIDGETSFLVSAVGDKGEAHGICQWHAGRADAILHGCGIDVRTAPMIDQCAAMHYEMTAGAYRRVWPLFAAAKDIPGAVTVLVHDLEQSAQQARDITRRSALAEKWQQVALNAGW